jgi:hypothetical protein
MHQIAKVRIYFFLLTVSHIRIVGGGNQSTRHFGHYWPIVPALGDCDDDDDDGEFG